MSIKVKVGGGRNIRAIPKEQSTTPIVAPAERKPQIVPDSVVLGIDTIGPYIQRIDAGQGIIVFPETDVELANVVISHANTTTEVSTNNDVLSFTRNVDIDQFGHVTQFYSTSLSSLNFTANGSLIQAKDFTIGNTSLTIGESTSSIEGLSTISVDGQSTFGSVNVTDLTPARIVYVGTDGELVDSDNLTFDGTSLTATNGVFLSGLEVNGQTTLDSVNVTDLTQTRIVYAGANGELIDSPNLTFDGTSLTAAGAVFLSGLQVDGQTDVDSLNVSDLTQGRIVYVGADGELIDSANLRFDDTSIIATGGVFLDDLSVPGQSTFGSVNILDLQEGRIMYAGANGELIDSANLYFDGVSLTATGGVFLDILEVPGQAEFGSVKVNDLTQNRVPYVGAGGALIDSNKLTFDGSTFTVDGDADITGNITIGGNIILGDAPIDTINVVADFTSDIIPDASDLYSLGTIGKNWFRVYTAAIKSDTGVVKIDENGALTLPTGGTGDRPTAETGMVRFNTTDNRFEGYDGSNWSELAGSVRDVNQDTFIRAETAAGDNNDQLDFFNNGVQSLQLDSDGDFKYGAGLNKVTIDHATGDTVIQGTLLANNQVTAASLNVLDLVTSGVVTTGPQGELRSSANLAWDGTTLTIVGGITVDGDFSTSGGLSGDSLSVGNLVANTIIYVSETGALSSNSSLAFDGETLTVNAHTTFSGPFFLGEIPEDRVLITGANGAVESDSGLTWDGTTLTIDGSADISGDVTIAGNLTLGDQTLDTINVVADFTSDLIPKTGSTYNLGEAGSNWNKLYINTIDADSDVVTFDINGAVTLPTGSSAERPTPVQGMIRYNTDDSRFEAYDGSAWTGIGGVIDTNQDTYILAEAGPGLNNDELQFFTAGVERFKVGNTGTLSTNDSFTFVANNGIYLTGSNVAVTSSTLDINSEFISDLIPRDDNTYDLGKGQVLNGNGVVIETGQNWNTIYVRNIGSDTDVVRVTANGAFIVPVGITADRPANLETGMVRFNATDGVFEGYSGVAWSSLGGVKDVNQDTYIQAETAPGVNNDELEFFTNGSRRFYVSNTGVITTDPGVDLVFDIGSDTFDVGNSIITGVNAPVNLYDAVNKDYLENTYAREYWVTKAANTYALDLLDVENPAKLELGEAITGYFDSANNKVTISLDPVWNSFTGLREAGPEGFIPNFEFDEYGRVRSLINIPLSVSSNAVVDFANSIFDVVGDAVRNGNQELGITVEPDYSTSKLNFAVRSFYIDLDGAVSGTGYVQNNSNTTITTTFDYPTLDARYLNVEGGDTANGALGATRFVDKDDTNYYVDPNSTSRIRDLQIGYGQSESQIQMATGPTSFQYIYATGTRIGYLSNNFNFGTYFDTTNNSWRVEDGSVFSRNFIDSQNTNYLLNPAGGNSRLFGLNIDTQLLIGGNLKLANNDIVTTSGDLVLNPATGIIDAGTSIITNVVDPVNNLDAVNKQTLSGEINTAISNLSANGISLSAESGTTDVVALGETINFAAGEGINTTVSNNQILIAGELANNTNIGVASFSINNFAVTGGEVTVTVLDGGTF